MRPVKRMMVVTLIAVPLAAALWLGSMFYYGTRPAFPEAFSISGWTAGGTGYAEFETNWNKQLDRLKQRKIELISNKPEIPSQSLTLEQLGLRIDDSAVRQNFNDLTEGSTLTRARNRWRLRSHKTAVHLSVDLRLLEAKVRAVWHTLYADQPVPAKRIITPWDEIRYEPEQTVLSINESRLKASIEQILQQPDVLAQAEPAGIELPFYQKAPDVTLRLLRDQRIDRLLTQFTTAITSSSAGRKHNVRSTASTLHDVILKPGEIFDYAPIIEQTGKKFGFREAPVILNGKLTPGVGGGICQVSTTLYNAVLRAGLEIVERKNHSLPISYAPMGQDATFSTGYINFRFRNDTNAHLLIRTEMTETALTVKLFGSIPRDTTYEIESTTVETLSPPVKYVHNPALQTGQQIVLSPGKQGFIVDTFRIKKQNGNVVSRERISRDRYSPQNKVVAANTGKLKVPAKQPPPQNNVIEDGVTGSWSQTSP
ncbi:VanW family protein [Paenibacillus sp. FJAT-26967]|uniref:VanW family protein n=1 Tax=Paenibacillus sp. FJAT-26967 TaxID=1729690 RepID=UPI0008392751|nr:VanW family protein [Paenibacillus sp. FJAT-26967]